MESKKKSRSCYCWLILVAVLILILAIVLTIIFVIRAKQKSQLSVISTSNTSITDQKYNITIKGLFTLNTATKSSICDNNSNITLEDCILVYNAKIIMSALLLIPNPTSDNSSVSFTFPKNSTKSTVDCKGLYIRRNQLPEIFESNTLQTLFDLSGVAYSSDDNVSLSNSFPRGDLRSQIDARSIQGRWSSPINYYISKTTGFTAPMIATIHLAIANWQNNTCLQFNELSVITSTTNKSYVLFQRDDEYGCSSPVGYDKTDPTSSILISAYCSGIIGSVMHEIGHTLGYIHTQSRVDRNSYVTIMTNNIQQDYAANFFMWAFGTIRFLDVTFPYDFGSFMHYEPYGFSNNGQPTIVPLDNHFERTMGQRERAAFYDYKQINRLYCNRADCPQRFTNSCQHNGYLDPKTCSFCICPDGFGGTYCEQRDPTSNCGDTITNPTPYSSTQITIQSPSPTSTVSTQQYCVYHIRSLSLGKVRLRLESLRTQRSAPCSFTSALEVKYHSDLALTGARWCGNTVPSGWLNVTAQADTMVVIFRANNYINSTTGNSQAGFRATVFFDAEPISAINPTLIPSTTVSSTTSTISTTTILTTTGTTSSVCPPSSFRCQLPSQPTCGGCLNYQPCTTQGTQLCTAYTYQAQLTGCDNVVNGVAQCRYQLVQTPYTTNCQRTILLCCPNYRLLSFQNNYYCVYNSQGTDLPTDWSLVL